MRLRPLLALAAALGGLACTDLLTDSVEWGVIEVEAVRHLGGGPVSGVPLTLFRHPNVQDVGVTDGSGFHRFAFVRPKASFGVAAEAPEGYVWPDFLVGGESVRVYDRIDIDEGDTARFSFAFLKIGPGAVEVTVRDAAGPPLQGVAVHLYDPAGTLASGLTDAEGRHTFDPVPFGNFGVRVAPSPHYVTWPEIEVYRQEILVDEDYTNAVLFELERCEAGARVSVLDSLAAPYPGAVVDASHVRGYAGTWTADAAGVAALEGLACAMPHVLSVYGPPGSHVPPVTAGPFAPVEGGVVELTVQLGTACVGSIRALAVDGADAPVAGAGVDLYTIHGIERSGTTSAGGEVAFADVTCGISYGVAVRPPAGYTVPEGAGSSWFDGLSVTSGEELTVTFRLQGG